MTKILLLEDNQDDAYLIMRALKKQELRFLIERVDTRYDFIESLHRFEPDVILSDHGLPGFSSQEALEICLTQNISIPFIMVSGLDPTHQKFDFVSGGADDYILKSDLTALVASINKAIKKKD